MLSPLLAAKSQVLRDTGLLSRQHRDDILANPEVVVENMPGAGSLDAANYLHNQAQPDGLTLGLWDSYHLFIQALPDDPVAERNSLRRSSDLNRQVCSKAVSSKQGTLPSGIDVMRRLVSWILDSS